MSWDLYVRSVHGALRTVLPESKTVSASKKVLDDNRGHVYIRLHQGAIDLPNVTEKELDAVFEAIRGDSIFSTLACTLHATPKPATSFSNPSGSMENYISLGLNIFSRHVTMFENTDTDERKIIVGQINLATGGADTASSDSSSTASGSDSSSDDSEVCTSYCKSAPPQASDSSRGSPAYKPSMVVEVTTNATHITDDFEKACSPIRDAIQCHLLRKREITHFKIIFLLSNVVKMHALDEDKRNNCGN